MNAIEPRLLGRLFFEQLERFGELGFGFVKPAPNIPGRNKRLTP